MKKLFNIIPSPHAWLVAAVVLYLLSFLFTPSFSPNRSTNQELNKLENYIHKNEREFAQFAADTLLHQRLINNTESQEQLTRLANKTTGTFIFSKTIADFSAKFWSNQKSYPADETFALPDTAVFEKQENGYYLTLKKTIPWKNPGDSLILIGMIPIMEHYSNILPDKFEYSKSATSKIVISGVATDFPVKTISGQTIFHITSKVQAISSSEGLDTVLKLIAAVLFLIYIHFIAEKISKRYGFWRGFIFLFIALFSIRLLGYYTSFPLNLRQFELFDPNIYASGSIHKSLGDLLINAVLFCWLVLFSWQKLDELGFENVRRGSKAFLLGIVGSCLVVTFTFIMANTIRSLTSHSDISFDVINFFSLRYTTVFGFIALAILAVGYYYFMRIMVPLLSVSFKNNFYPVYIVVAVTGLTFLTVEIGNPLLVFYIVVLGWLVFYIWLTRLRKFGINNQRQTMAGALFWIFFFSVSITAVIINGNREKEWQLRINRAEKIDRRTDPYNEDELNIAFIYIDNDFLAPNFYRFQDSAKAMFLRDSIVRKQFYLRNFDSRLYVFDAERKPLFNDEAESFFSLDALLKIRAKETSTPNLLYYETSYDKITYIYKQTVTDPEGKLLGYLFILSDPSQYDTDALHSKLFTQSDPSDPDETIYNDAIYILNVLSTSPNNEYPFPTILSPSDIPDETITRRTVGGASELWYRASGEKIIVIARSKETALEAITLFSYIFCIFLFLVGFFNVFILLLKVGGDIREFRKIFEWNIRTQIHGTIIFISVLSFVIIGVATISFFIIRYDQNNKERLARTMEIMIREMEKKLDTRRALDDQVAIYDSVSNDEVQGLVDEVSKIHNVDVNVYDTTGSLHVTSHPLIYRDGLLSQKMHPSAFYHINRLRQVQYVQQEQLANIKYMSIYAPLRGTDDGIAYAYINIPYFLSQKGLKQEISNFLVTIINLNAFIFLIAGVIALFITNRVTRSFLLISEKMREVNLGKTNEEIDWKRNDEIGGLVREYNKMVKKLEVSAEALARSEREGAWREMARQVAHEIKNPLTPMKLSIQFLQKSIDNNSENVKELTAKVAKTLVEQIDHLSKIAFDFSQFANIGNTNIETFDINEVIHSLDNLYKTSHEGDLKLNTVPGKVMVRADKTQMNRLFTNLIQNAIEACDGKSDCRIELNEVQVNGVVQISVKDNGAGIPSEMHSKIFVPNFTTKTSGTGLGLAMCKGIAEQAGGRIWFETLKGEGSVFYVELPVVN